MGGQPGGGRRRKQKKGEIYDDDERRKKKYESREIVRYVYILNALVCRKTNSLF